MRYLFNRAAQRLKTVFFALLFLTLGIEWLVISKGGDAISSYPDTYHGMKWNKEKQDRLEAKIAAAEARIGAWAAWSIPTWIAATLGTVLICGMLLGAGRPSTVLHAFWATIFVGVRTCLDFLGWLILAGGLPSWSLFWGWSFLSFFLVVLTATVTRRAQTGSWPYFRRPPPSNLLGPDGRPLAGAAPTAAPTWISAIGGIASLVAAINGILKLLMEVVHSK
jgi:hypothetical protein